MLKRLKTQLLQRVSLNALALWLTPPKDLDTILLLDQPLSKDRK